jgi:hypothetical protein
VRRLLQARRLAQLQFRAHEGLHPRSRRLTRLLIGASLLQRPLRQPGACPRLQDNRLHHLLHRTLFLLRLASLLEETLASAEQAPQHQGSEQGT